MALDLTSPLPDLEEDGPSGPNLEFDAAFGELERTAQGTPERQAGDKIVPAEDPVWKDVATQAAALMERTYDLRVFVHLAVARLHTSGLQEFGTVMTAIASVLDARWDSVHPQLDPEDDNDPSVRANALLPLASPSRVLRPLRALQMAASKRGGPVSWRSIAMALGEIETPEDQERPSETEVRAAGVSANAARVEGLTQHIDAVQRAVKAITAAFDTHSGYGNQPDLTGLTKLLSDMRRYVDRFYVPAAADAVPAEDVPDDAADMGAEESAAGAAAPAARGGRSGMVSVMSLTSVASRAEALHLLDVVMRYFQTNEPSSPLPLMLTRARGLADKSFLEILQDLAPDGLGQAQIIVQSREG